MIFKRDGIMMTGEIAQALTNVRAAEYVNGNTCGCADCAPRFPDRIDPDLHVIRRDTFTPPIAIGKNDTISIRFREGEAPTISKNGRDYPSQSVPSDDTR